MGVHIADVDAPRPDTTPAEKDPGTTDAKKPESVIPDTDPADDDTKKEGDNTQKEGDNEGGEGESEKDPEKSGTEFASVMDGWTNEFLENGSLTEETRKTVLESVFTADVPAEVRETILDGYLAGQIAVRTALTQEAFALVGGESQYKQMLQWGVDNLPEDEVKAFDADVLGGDASRRSTAIKGLYAQMKQAKGSDFEPDLTHDGGRSHGEPIIASRSQLVRIMQSAEYQTDEAVRLKVARQLKQSVATGRYIAD